MNILKTYEDYCGKQNIPFEDIQSIKSYDESTLFCPAGMQKFKKEFISKRVGTIGNNQRCLRTDDLGIVGDGIHFACFNMLGLFSFRDWSMKKAIDFWIGFLCAIGLKVEEAHVHPKRKDWSRFYPKGTKVIEDQGCEWSDGDIGGYCTEFYVRGVEIGNIVNTLGHSIDCGFGLERLSPIQKSREEILSETVLAITEAGYEPGNKKQGYVLRRLLKELSHTDLVLPYLKEEQERQIKIKKRYESLKNKFPDKTREWWFETHGIEV